MIAYKSGPFGFRLLLRLQGSAVARALIPSTISTAFLLCAWEIFPQESFGDLEERFIGHPYAIGALLAAFSFIITFRANFAYHRYWEAAGSVHQMHSKWMDAAMSIAAFHYQASQYDRIRPPAFGAHQELNNIVKERFRNNECSAEEMKEELKCLIREKEAESRTGMDFSLRGQQRSVRNYVGQQNDVSSVLQSEGVSYTTTIPSPAFASSSSVSALTAPHIQQREEPSLFLQEASHLISLLSAVALSSLRDDIEGAEIPLVEHVPGLPFPPVDPSDLSAGIRATFYERNRCSAVLRFLFGISRGRKQRTLYNAARPFRVLGGVSDAEALILKHAKGSIAKVSLCTMWLTEFIQREHMAGSTGSVAPPIISRVYQYLSDGTLGYNQARKVAYIPFPFPHSQMIVLFVTVIVMVMPMLMFSFVNGLYLGAALNFCTVLCFAGLNEVARELENPFQNAPNDLPLTNFQAQFNEGLIEMFAGFHPDAFWEVLTQNRDRDQSVRMDTYKNNRPSGNSSGYGSIELSRQKEQVSNQ